MNGCHKMLTEFYNQVQLERWMKEKLDDLEEGF